MSENLGLFAVATTQEFSYKVNEDSKLIDNYRTLFFLFGKALGKALFDNIQVSLCLNRSIFKALLSQDSEADFSDLEEFKYVDYNVYNSLKFFRDNSLKEHEEIIEQYFTTEVATSVFGSEDSSTVELVPGGSRIRVTDANKLDFIRKKCYYISYRAVKDQLTSIVDGFHKVIPTQWVSVFTVEELEAAMCGNAHIDIEDWKRYTELKGYSKFSMTVSRFWKAMGTYSQVELARILQFCTGTSRLPLGGFKSLESHRGEKAKFSIQKVNYDGAKGVMSNLPKAHTCFNRLDLPRYPSYNDLKQALDFIAKNDIAGFGLEE